MTIEVSGHKRTMSCQRPSESESKSHKIVHACLNYPLARARYYKAATILQNFSGTVHQTMRGHLAKPTIPEEWQVVFKDWRQIANEDYDFLLILLYELWYLRFSWITSVIRRQS